MSQGHRDYMVDTIEIRRGVRMTPVYVGFDKQPIVDGDVNDRILNWIEAIGMVGDRYSNDWTFYWDNEEAAFLFRDPRVAMLFKLVWG